MKTDLEKLLNTREYFLYKKFTERRIIKERRRLLDKELKQVMLELNKYSDINIGKELGVCKQAVGQFKSNLYGKCKRLGIDFKM